MFEQTVNLEIEEAYSKLKTALLDSGCKIISEEPQKQICFKHGSLWGISPKTAKKIVNLHFESVVGGTKVSSSSWLASDWKNITIVGCALAIVLVSLCVWMATDLSSLIVTHVPGFWSWLVMVGSNVNLVAAQALVNLTWGLAVFLSVIILLEIVIVIYVGSKIDLFAKDTLNLLN